MDDSTEVTAADVAPLPTVADLIAAQGQPEAEAEAQLGDPDQVYVPQYEHGEAPAATCPKPPKDDDA